MKRLLAALAATTSLALSLAAPASAAAPEKPWLVLCRGVGVLPDAEARA